MSRCCPHCGGSGFAPGEDVGPLAERLRAACRERGLWVSPDDRVREADAADLIGWQTKTMRNRRYEDAPIPFVKRQGRALYALADLAAWIETA